MRAAGCWWCRWVDRRSVVFRRSSERSWSVRVDINGVCRMWKRLRGRPRLRWPNVRPRLGLRVFNRTGRLFRCSQNRGGCRGRGCHAGLVHGTWRFSEFVCWLWRPRLHRKVSGVALVALETPLRSELLSFLAQLSKYGVEGAASTVDGPPSGAHIDATTDAHLVARLKRILRRFN